MVKLLKTPYVIFVYLNRINTLVLIHSYLCLEKTIHQLKNIKYHYF